MNYHIFDIIVACLKGSAWRGIVLLCASLGRTLRELRNIGQ
jgi:hypothetical protein